MIIIYLLGFLIGYLLFISNSSFLGSGQLVGKGIMFLIILSILSKGTTIYTETYMNYYAKEKYNFIKMCIVMGIVNLINAIMIASTDKLPAIVHTMDIEVNIFNTFMADKIILQLFLVGVIGAISTYICIAIYNVSPISLKIFFGTLIIGLSCMVYYSNYTYTDLYHMLLFNLFEDRPDNSLLCIFLLSFGSLVGSIFSAFAEKEFEGSILNTYL